jgi:hypothetical protein
MISPTLRTPRQLLVAPNALDWQDADMTATFGAQARFDQLDSHPSLWLPVDCQGNPAATVGDLVSQNTTGPLRLGFGAWRDLLLGCQFYNGGGDLITAGGRTVKNVAGYDLTKFLVGQSGTIGKLATITTRVYRKPQDALLAEFPPDQTIFNRLIASPCRPQWAMLTANSLTCGYLGRTSAIDYYQQRLADHHPTRITHHGFAADCQWRCDHWRILSQHPLQMRAGVAPMKIAEFARASNLRDWVADPAFGIVLVGISRDEMDLVTDAAASVGGRAWFTELAPSGPGRRLIHCSLSPAERAIVQRLKTAFDRNDHLSPLPRIGADE